MGFRAGSVQTGFGFAAAFGIASAVSELGLTPMISEGSPKFPSGLSIRQRVPYTAE